MLLFSFSGSFRPFVHAWFKPTGLLRCFVWRYVPLSLPQLPVGAGFSWNADRPWTHHRFLHRGDARRHGRSRTWQRFGGRPQEALQEAERVWKRIPQQVNAKCEMKRIDGWCCRVCAQNPKRRTKVKSVNIEGASEVRMSENLHQSSTFLCDWISL